MARRFFYLSLGILCLAIAYNLGARSAGADWDESGFGQIAGAAESGEYWSQAGECYYLNPSNTWTRAPGMDLPVAASEVKMIGSSGAGGVTIITHSDQVWTTASGDWGLAPPFPGSGTPVQKESWGGVKRRWR